VKTFSSFSAGRTWGYDAPFESGRFYQSPGYYHERVSPRGHEQYGVPPRVEGVIERRLTTYPPPVVTPAPIAPLPPPP